MINIPINLITPLISQCSYIRPKGVIHKYLIFPNTYLSHLCACIVIQTYEDISIDTPIYIGTLFPYLLHSIDGSNIISKHCCSALYTAFLSEEYIKWYRILTQWIKCLNTLIPLEEVYEVIKAHINTYVIPTKESSLPLSLTLLIDKHKPTFMSIYDNSPS